MQEKNARGKKEAVQRVLTIIFPTMNVIFTPNSLLFKPEEGETIIIDIRGNWGGNSNLNKLIMDFTREHKDKKLICLTDYRVFSAGRYALRDLIELGATTIGEEIGTPINCYGDSNWFEINNLRFSVSECYFNPFERRTASSKEEFKSIEQDEKKDIIFKPNIEIKQSKDDFINNIDTILNFAIEYSKD